MTPPVEPPRYPPKPQPGDRVAVVSPSSGLPELFPLPYDLGIARLRTHFHLEPVEPGDAQDGCLAARAGR
ncbi:hypothetical protein GCM10010245_30200 [Streptomyces spectabilis]|uniref:Muramoyltetrapeptide carboxypeptidase LdcA involved in peptidoglycan recycling n=1 Tax=Streptomyces spectabilis TaxID=68270 RepID=A0A7W8ARF8_STRST|nr:muramoyltetrapeptide carboxypeptidase LdcA involved in peptidoglycan recycling [Streptomyces spectabilis]GGV17529.1 hypothetical protein GCM10010245_30200 [Streptomyces spectabilis]